MREVAPGEWRLALEAGEVLVCGELPVESVAEETLDRFLGLLVAGAVRARQFVTGQR